LGTLLRCGQLPCKAAKEAKLMNAACLHLRVEEARKCKEIFIQKRGCFEGVKTSYKH